MEKIRRQIICFFAFVTIFSVSLPDNAFAINSNYLSGELIEERYWDSCQNVINIDKENLIGNIKYIPDGNNSCFYMRIQFHSTADDYDASQVQIHLTVSNSENKYRMQFDNKGKNEELLTLSNDNFKIYYSFDLYPTKRQGGYIYIGFEFKNKTDKTLKNVISCAYSCGTNDAQILFEDVIMDMVKPTTQKQSTTKKTTSKSEKTAKQSTAKSSSKESSKTTNSKTETTKYIPSNLYTAGNSDKIETADEYTEGAVNRIAEETTVQNEVTPSPHLSDTSEKLLISAGVITAIGILSILIGLMFKSKNAVDNSLKNADDSIEPKN